MKPAFIYRFLKQYCKLGLSFYFRKWQVKGRENIPTKGPLIFVANHQNAFIDAILMTCASSRNPYYLARAGVFNKPWAAKLLSLIHLKPIYRFRDGFSTLKNNDIILQECVDLMKQDQVILLFPEANHNEPWSMREFQKGFARLAIQFHQQSNGTPLRIVPMGIHYSEHHSFNQRVLINIGKPILVDEILSQKEGEREKLDYLSEVTRKAVQELALDIKPIEEYLERKNHLVKNRIYKTDLYEQFLSDKETVALFPIEKNSNTLSNSLLQATRFPIVLAVYITHGPLYFLIKRFINKKIRDPQFISSVKYALGIFLTPAYYLLLSILVYLISENVLYSLLFIFSLPILLLTFAKTARN